MSVCAVSALNAGKLLLISVWVALCGSPEAERPSCCRHTEIEQLQRFQTLSTTSGRHQQNATRQCPTTSAVGQVDHCSVTTLALALGALCHRSHHCAELRTADLLEVVSPVDLWLAGCCLVLLGSCLRPRYVCCKFKATDVMFEGI